MKVYQIKGKLLVYDDCTHQEMIDRFYWILKSNGFFFVGETNDITDEYIISDEM